MTLQVRAMQNGDIDSVYSIELVAHRAPWSREIISDCVLVGYDCRVLELVDDAGVEIAGYIICRYHDGVCHILNLCIPPSLQRKGYGQFLLQYVIDSPAVKGTNSALLEARPSNKGALHLYNKMGFQQVGYKRGYYRDDPVVEDAIVLQKQMLDGPSSL